MGLRSLQAGKLYSQGIEKKADRAGVPCEK
jgi:hypothetical protein